MNRLNGKCCSIRASTKPSFALCISSASITNDPWAQFYAGAAYAYKSAQLSRDGKYWPAYRAIQSSLDYLEPLIRQDSTFCDALLGVGTYQYWRSRVTIKFSWLPFFPDRRREGIAKILHASRCSRFSPASAWSNLTWIYIKEKNYDQAIHYARLGLEKYPSSRFFLWPLAEAQFLKADYAAAGETYTALLHSTRNAAHNNGYNELVILWKLAQSCEHLEQTAQAQIWYQEVVACPVDGAVSKRAENKKRRRGSVVEKDSGSCRAPDAMRLDIAVIAWIAVKLTGRSARSGRLLPPQKNKHLACQHHPDPNRNPGDGRLRPEPSQLKALPGKGEKPVIARAKMPLHQIQREMQRNARGDRQTRRAAQRWRHELRRQQAGENGKDRRVHRQTVTI